MTAGNGGNGGGGGDPRMLVEGLEKARILRETGGASTKDWVFPNQFNKAFLPGGDPDAVSPPRHQQNNNQRIDSDNLYSNVKSSSHKNRTLTDGERTKEQNGGGADADNRAPVTATIDATTIHYVNATVKPTLAPAVEGYEKVESGEVRIFIPAMSSDRMTIRNREQGSYCFTK